MPKIRVGRVLAPLLAIGIVLAMYQLSLKMLDRITSPFRIKALMEDFTDLSFRHRETREAR